MQHRTWAPEQISPEKNIEKLKKTIKLDWNISNIGCQNLFSNLPEWHHYNIAHTGTQKQQSLYVVTRKHQLVQNWLGKGNVNCELQVWMLFGTGTLVDPKWLICSWNTNRTVNMLFFHNIWNLKVSKCIFCYLRKLFTCSTTRAKWFVDESPSFACNESITSWTVVELSYLNDLVCPFSRNTFSTFGIKGCTESWEVIWLCVFEDGYKL